MGIEPTPRTGTARDSGFEDRERHQPLSASFSSELYQRVYET